MLNAFRFLINSQNDSNKKNVFGNFTFNKTPNTTTFDFLNKPKSVDDSKINGLSNSPFKINSHDNEEDYFAKLKGLNETVSNWIKQHVDGNPFVNLTPIFKDYEKYFVELENAKRVTVKKQEHTTIFQKTSSKIEEVSGMTPVKSVTTTSFKSTIESVSTPKTETIAAPTFTFGIPTASNVNFNFGSNATAAKTGFTFGNASSTPCTFKNVAAPTITNKEEPTVNDVEEDEDEPPKVEIKEVEEEGHIFKIRCKVFIKKDVAFTDKGVGNLFLKPITDSEKVQVIVRADTNLGNVLCNFILSENIPIQKKGKKEVLLVCYPTPEFTSHVPLLIRVKTPEEAETLYQELEKNKR